MKNNLIVAGVPRAGKSTISHLLSQRFGYQHVSMDAVIAGFEKCFPETGVSTYQGLSSMDTLRVISGKMAPFVRAMLESGEYDEFRPGMVLDMYQLLPEDYDRHVRGANCEIAYFITSDVTPEERFLIQKRHDTEKDYTFWKTDEELREGAVYIVEQSRLIREQCERLGLPYYETARDREQSFRRFLRDFGFEREEAGAMVIRKAGEEDVRAVSEIIVEGWQTAYRGIIDGDFLDSLSVESQYQRDVRRFGKYRVAADERGVLGFAWNEVMDGEDADCEIIALYVRASERKKGVGRALLQDAMDAFRKAGRKRMIIWCLKENHEARKFYEKTGGRVFRDGTHNWGGREYDMISYLYRL